MARGDTNLPIDETLPILPEEEVYEVDIYGVGETTDAMGGIGGEANVPSRGLVNRTAWLKKVYNLLIVKVGDLTRFALKHGSSSNRFKVANAEAINEAISKAQLDSAIDNIDVDLSGYALKSHTHLTKDFIFEAYSMSTQNNNNDRITNENIFGDTNLSLAREDVRVKLLGNMAFIDMRLNVKSFNKKVANDATWSFKYALLAAINDATSNKIEAITSHDFGMANFVFTGSSEGGRDIARQSCNASVAPDGTCFFSEADTAGVNTGQGNTNQQVDSLWVQAFFMIRVGRK